MGISVGCIGTDAIPGLLGAIRHLPGPYMLLLQYTRLSRMKDSQLRLGSKDEGKSPELQHRLQTTLGSLTFKAFVCCQASIRSNAAAKVEALDDGQSLRRFGTYQVWVLPE